MAEGQLANELIAKGTDNQTKFVQGMISIALGTLALSFQFSTNLKLFPYLLLLGWIILFVSALLGGWRIYILSSIYFINANLLQSINRVSILKESGGALVDENGLRWTREQYEEALERNEKLAAESRQMLEAFSPKANKIYHVQIFTLMAGLFIIGLFTAINFIKDT